MFERRKALAEVFIDTQLFFLENEQLKEAIRYSKENTVFYPEGEELYLPDKKREAGEIAVTQSKTFEAAMQWKKAHSKDRVAVLNFASAVNPGGGVKGGSSAQEESLCRCSTLYPTLDQQFLWDAYYNKNRMAKNVLHTDDCIWSPDIIICKTDEDIPQRIEPMGWEKVDVISCAAPNLRQQPDNYFNPEGGVAVRLSTEDLIQLHIKRAMRILCVAASNGVEVLILGAFGCGAFENDPWAVATAYRSVLPEYRHYFKRIEFAIYCRRYETKNYEAFKQILS